MKTLEECREIIDYIDKDIIALLAKRMEVAMEIALLKKNANQPVFQPAREKEVIEKIKAMTRENNLEENTFVTVYERIIEVIRNSQMESTSL